MTRRDAGDKALKRFAFAGRRGAAGRLFPGEQRLLEAESAQVTDAPGVQDAVQVIHLMLDDPGVKTVDGTFEAPSAGIHAAVTDAGATGYQAAHARYAQAPFPALFHGIAQGRDLGVDEHGHGHRGGVRVAGIALHAEYHHAYGLSDLRCRQPGAVIGRHGVEHVLYQRIEAPCVKLNDRLGGLQQHGMAHAEYLSDCHDIPVDFEVNRERYPGFRPVTVLRSKGPNTSHPMRIQYILPALAGLMAAATAAADTPTDHTKTPAPAPWYQVEVVIFAHSDATDTEIWRDDPGVPDTAHAVSLSPAVSSPDLKRQLQALSGPDDQGQALAAFLDAGANGDSKADDTTPVAFRLLPDSADQLQDVVSRLNHADGYRVLYHAAWRQPAYSPDKAVPVRIDDDPYETQAAMLRSWDQAAGQAGDQAGDQAAGAVGDNGNDNGGAAAAAPLVWRLDGIVELTQSRYLHLRADLLYQVHTPADTDEGTQPDGTVDEDTEVVHTYRMEQSRRILNDKLYYFDHPEFGLLAKVTPYEVPKPAAPEVVPQQPEQPAPDVP